VIYLYLDKYSGSGPMTNEQLEAMEKRAAPKVVLNKAA
jgi:hypothetical protein